MTAPDRDPLAPTTEAGRNLVRYVNGGGNVKVPALILAIEQEAAAGSALDVDDVREWLDSADGRLEDVFGLWVQGKRDSAWVAEKLVGEGHLARLTGSRP